ncbi:F5/8 type C domain-containing protein [Halanaerobium saccharolyticum]|uniref:F5/8 type C domain-containing protein n=1 Tax=Halanaerobium saccharolyticum TaxID=43595 RepID=A0A4R6LC51_9FIRM|nr:discoidin domain-containing protein [Halanaerobium saccharolyticum]TDO73391.1 F5/8 type C domain-containing protein [Halanaerobium saccharolyticum]
MIKRNLPKKIKILSIIMTLLITTFLLIYLSSSLFANQAAEFYKASNVRFYHENEKFYLKLDTPVEVLCAVNFARSKENYNNVTAMDMVAPVVNHLVELDFEPEQKYKVLLTAFTEDHEIYRSQEYILNTNLSDNENYLIAAKKGKARKINLETSALDFNKNPEITNLTGSGVKIKFSSNEPTLSSTAIGSTNNFGRIARAPGSNPSENHQVTILGLQSESKYFTETITIDKAGKLIRSKIMTFRTPQIEAENVRENQALLEKGAEITAVSSNFGNDISGSFGALNTIDGDPGTEWSSQGEGDEAWIEIKLKEKMKINGFGFWSRTMGDTGEIRVLKVLTGDGENLGTFTIPDAEKLYNFSFPSTTAEKLRFEVVESTGGNTGARTIRIYGEN